MQRASLPKPVNSGTETRGQNAVREKIVFNCEGIRNGPRAGHGRGAARVRPALLRRRPRCGKAGAASAWRGSPMTDAATLRESGRRRSREGPAGGCGQVALPGPPGQNRHALTSTPNGASARTRPSADGARWWHLTLDHTGSRRSRDLRARKRRPAPSQARPGDHPAHWHSVSAPHA